jgi:hypothetical protein
VKDYKYIDFYNNAAQNFKGDDGPRCPQELRPRTQTRRSPVGGKAVDHNR